VPLKKEEKEKHIQLDNHRSPFNTACIQIYRCIYYRIIKLIRQEIKQEKLILTKILHLTLLMK